MNKWEKNFEQKGTDQTWINKKIYSQDGECVDNRT